MDYRVTAHSPATYQDVVRALFDAAREGEDFVFGPMNDPVALEVEGMKVQGAGERVATVLRVVPGVTVDPL